MKKFIIYTYTNNRFQTVYFNSSDIEIALSEFKKLNPTIKVVGIMGKFR